MNHQRPGGAKRHWRVLPRATAGELSGIGPYPPLLCQLLINRGVSNPLEAQAFLEPGFAGETDPFLMPDARPAVERLVRAVRSGETVAVFGDFDADGITSTALLVQGLRAVDARVVTYMPERVAEGHGLNLGALHTLRELGASLIVTADCGITSMGEVAAASDMGIDTVITDHHSPPERLPDAVAVVNPKLWASSGGYADLASVGVASRLVDALYAELGRPADASLLEFVALGTIADLAPMTSVNRDLVRRGLESLNRTTRPGLRALMKAAGVSPGRLDTEAVSYSLAPRINAPGRIGRADPSYQLLTAASPEEAEPLARELNERNAERQRMTREVVERVKMLVEDPTPAIVVLGAPELPPGIIGLAAGKLAEELHRPAVVYQTGPEETRGSCRSIPEFNIIEALDSCAELLTRHGGHAQAAGFTMSTALLPELKRRLLDTAGKALDTDTLVPETVIDAEIRMERLTGPVIKALRDLAPHGPLNQVPIFLARRMEVRGCRLMGDQGQHARIALRAGGLAWSAVAFDSELGSGPLPPEMDVVFTFGVDRMSGTLQMRVMDMAPSA